MTGFLDASALAKNYVAERGRDHVRRVLEEGGTAVSRLSEVEVASGLMRRVRSGELTAEEYGRARQMLKIDFDDLQVIELDPDVVALAISLFERHPLRAGDAIQLASCLSLRDRSGEQLSFLAYDRRLNDAAAFEGLPLVEGSDLSE